MGIYINSVYFSGGGNNEFRNRGIAIKDAPGNSIFRFFINLDHIRHHNTNDTKRISIQFLPEKRGVPIQEPPMIEIKYQGSPINYSYEGIVATSSGGWGELLTNK
jgi:hypothetical protein